MKYHFKIHKEGDGFWAECLEDPGCVTQGESKEELFENMQKAINTYLEEPESSNFLAPLPLENVKKRSNVVKVPVDPEVAFGFLVRYNRLKRGLSQKEAAKKLGMKDIFSYQRLERKCNASLKTIARLTYLYPSFPFDRIFR